MHSSKFDQNSNFVVWELKIDLTMLGKLEIFVKSIENGCIESYGPQLCDAINI